VAGLYTRWFHRWALVLGWAAAMVYGTIEAYRTPGGGQAHFGASTAPVFGHVIYIAIAAFILNLAVAIVLTFVFRAIKLPAGTDETLPGHYTADPAEGPAAAVPAPAATTAP
jgi:SSS family solute:Na+ symporter